MPVHGSLTCSVDELRTLFLFEKLTDDQLQWLCERGHVELIEPGRSTREGAPATCFYVLLEGTVVMSRRVGADDIEVGRTVDARRVLGRLHGLPRRPGAAGLQQLGAGNRAVAVLRAGRLGLRRADARLVPDGGAPAGGAVLRQQEHPGGDRAAGTAAGARLAVGGPDPRAEQPGRGRGAGHGRRCASGSPGCGTSWA